MVSHKKCEVNLMANMHNQESSFNARMTYQADAQELSETRYNLTIGATLTWGFVLNVLLLQFVGPAILNMIYTSPQSYSTFMIGFLIGYVVLVLIGSSMVRSYNPVKCFIGYNLIAIPVGIVVAMATIGYDPALVTRAALVTAIVTLSMMIVSMILPDTFSRMGSGLGVSLLIVIIVESLSMLLFRSAITLIDWIVVVIMAMYIGYDWVRANSVQRTTTNAIAAASALYLDIINIFLRVLRILARSRDN